MIDNTVVIVHIYCINRFAFLLTNMQLYILNIISTPKSCLTKNLDVHSCQAQLKHAIEIEYEICNKNKTLVKFEKFNCIYNNL